MPLLISQILCVLIVLFIRLSLEDLPVPDFPEFVVCSLKKNKIKENSDLL